MLASSNLNCKGRIQRKKKQKHDFFYRNAFPYTTSAMCDMEMTLTLWFVIIRTNKILFSQTVKVMCLWLKNSCFLSFLYEFSPGNQAISDAGLLHSTYGQGRYLNEMKSNAVEVSQLKRYIALIDKFRSASGSEERKWKMQQHIESVFMETP